MFHYVDLTVESQSLVLFSIQIFNFLSPSLFFQCMSITDLKTDWCRTECSALNSLKHFNRHCKGIFSKEKNIKSQWRPHAVKTNFLSSRLVVFSNRFIPRGLLTISNEDEGGTYVRQHYYPVYFEVPKNLLSVRLLYYSKGVSSTGSVHIILNEYLLLLFFFKWCLKRRMFLGRGFFSS